jgi:hypothetical protein
MAMEGRGEVVMENGRGGDAAEKVEPVGIPCGYSAATVRSDGGRRSGGRWRGS